MISLLRMYNNMISRKKWFEENGIVENKDKMPPRLTIAYTYYNEPELLKEQIKLWEDYPPGVEIMVIDDGSEEYPAYDILKDVYFTYGVNFQLWKVARDLGFNSHGCRNLAAKYAPTDQICFLDIDMRLNPGDVGHLRRIAMNPKTIYRFNMYAVFKKQWYPYPGHINCFIVNKDTFWEAGGYDESYTGHHYGDRPFHKELDKLTKQANTGLTLNNYRTGRKMVTDYGLADDTIMPVYDNVEMKIKYPGEIPDFDAMANTLKSKLNFPFVRLM